MVSDSFEDGGVASHSLRRQRGMPISCAHLMCPSDVVIVALGGTGLEYKALCLVGEERSVGVEWGA